MSRRAPPGVPAYAVADEPGRPAVQLAMWCPWCEGLHYHGAAGGGGSRSVHCDPRGGSPLRPSGYRLEVAGTVTDAQAVEPRRMMAGRQLWRVVDQASGSLRAVLLRHLLGVRRVSGVVEKVQAAGRVLILTADAWMIEAKGGGMRDGRGFLRLAAVLYGVTPGIVAVRLLEAVSLDVLDDEATLAVAAAVDEWASRGGPGGLRGAR